MTLATEPENLTPENSRADLPPPTTQVVNPPSFKIDNIYRNIENEPLIKKVKSEEIRLEELLGIDSVDIDLEEAEKGQQDPSEPKKGTPEWNASVEKSFKTLLDDFNKLLKTAYGPLGYLVMSDSESIVKLYGVDSDDDYYLYLRSSIIRVSSKRLEKMVVGGGGRRFIGERGLTIHDPAEITGNMKVADHVINEIISSIRRRLG